MTFILEEENQAKLQKMCSEAMGFLMCTYDFGKLAIRRDLVLKTVNYFVTHNLGFMKSLASSNLLVKENAFCLSFAEKESRKYFGYYSEEDIQLYHYAYWVAVNALMLKEHGSSEFFNKIFKEATDRCFWIPRKECSSVVLAVWLGIYTAGVVKRKDLVDGLAMVLDTYLGIVHKNDNFELHNEIFGATKLSVGAVDQAFRLINSNDSLFKLIFRPLPEINQDNFLNDHQKDKEIKIFSDEEIDEIVGQSINSEREGESELHKTVDKSQVLLEKDKSRDEPVVTREVTCSSIQDHHVSEERQEATTKSNQSNDASKSKVTGRLSYIIPLSLVLFAVVGIVSQIEDDDRNNNHSKVIVTEFNVNEYFRARSCIENQIKLDVEELRYMTDPEKDFSGILGDEVSAKCNNLDVYSKEYERANREITNEHRESLIENARSNLYKVGDLFNDLSVIGEGEENNLMNICYKLKDLGYEIKDERDIRENTFKAIKKFQEDFGLIVTGRPSDSLVSALDAELMSLGKTNTKKEIELIGMLHEEMSPSHLVEYGFTSEDISRAANGDLEKMLKFSHAFLAKGDSWQAFDWTKLAAKKGSAEAQLQLANFYYNGIGCSANINKARYWLEQASKAGHIQAKLRLANFHLQGIGGLVNRSAAFDLVSSSCSDGSSSACGKLGYLIYKGIGTKKDPKKGIELLKLNVQSGDALDEYYFYKAIIESKLDEFLDISQDLLMSSVSKGFEAAIFEFHSKRLNSFDLSKTEKEKSISAMRELADNGYTDAQVFFARYLAFNTPDKKELDNAKIYLSKAILKGRADAILTLADIYHFGDKPGEWGLRASRWYTLGCLRGNEEACVEVHRINWKKGIRY